MLSATSRRRQHDTNEPHSSTETDHHSKQDGALSSNTNSPPPRAASQGRGLTVAILAVIFLGSFIEQAARHLHVETTLLRVSTAAGIVWVGRRVWLFRRWADETPHLLRFSCFCAAMILALVVENAAVWTISALDGRKRDRDVQTLQDNVALLADHAEAALPGLRTLLRLPWMHMNHFLACMLCLSFSVAWDQVRYSGLAMSARFFLTMALMRIVRVIAFMCVVVPSPRGFKCARRFDYWVRPVPTDPLEIARHAFKSIRGIGGCNDLIISGHGVVWALVACMVHSYHPGPCAGLLWVAVAQASLKAAVERQHYSVDMFLAVLVTALLWRTTAWVCPEGAPLRPRPPGLPSDRRDVRVLVPIAIVMGLVLGYVLFGRW